MCVQWRETQRKPGNLKSQGRVFFFAAIARLKPNNILAILSWSGKPLSSSSLCLRGFGSTWVSASCRRPISIPSTFLSPRSHPLFKISTSYLATSRLIVAEAYSRLHSSLFLSLRVFITINLSCTFKKCLHNIPKIYRYILIEWFHVIKPTIWFLITYTG